MAFPGLPYYHFVLPFTSLHFTVPKVWNSITRRLPFQKEGQTKQLSNSDVLFTFFFKKINNSSSFCACPILGSKSLRYKSWKTSFFSSQNIFLKFQLSELIIIKANTIMTPELENLKCIQLTLNILGDYIPGLHKYLTKLILS